MDRGNKRHRSGQGRSEYRVSVALPEDLGATQLVFQLDSRTEEIAPRGPTLREFGPRWIAQYAKANRQKPSGVTTKESHLRIHLYPLAGELELEAIDTAQIQQLKATLASKSAKTVNNVLSTLSMLLKTAVKWGELERMPCQIETLKLVEPPFEFYDRATYLQLVQGAHAAGVNEAALVLLAGDCGLRKGELVALEWKDLELERLRLTVNRSETRHKVTLPKGGKTRVVPLTGEVAVVLRQLAARGPRVFYRKDGSPMSGHRICTLLARAQRQAGLADPGALHILRHTYCSHLAMAGVPARAIQELAGHVSIRTTERYMHLSPGEKSRAVEQLELYRRG